MFLFRPLLLQSFNSMFNLILNLLTALYGINTKGLLRLQLKGYKAL